MVRKVSSGVPMPFLWLLAEAGAGAGGWCAVFTGIENVEVRLGIRIAGVRSLSLPLPCVDFGPNSYLLCRFLFSVVSPSVESGYYLCPRAVVRSR